MIIQLSSSRLGLGIEGEEGRPPATIGTSTPAETDMEV
jgi:hypothetical protein